MKIISLQKQLGDFSLKIDNLEFEIGAVHGLIGPNGSGKSTLAKIIVGITEPDFGKINLAPLSQNDITMTSQKPYLLHDTVYNNLIYPLKIRKIKPDESEINSLLDKCGMLDKKKQYARSLSSGEQQKLSFIRAMIFKPKLIIIDETLSNLDPDSVELFENIILDKQKNDPITWISISHQLVHISKICDKIHFLSDGQNIQSGTINDVLLNPSNEIVKKYMSSTEISFNMYNSNKKEKQ